jgi:protein SCO1/2
VARIVQLGGMLTVAGLGGFMFVMFRKDMQLGRDHDVRQDVSRYGDKG